MSFTYDENLFSDLYKDANGRRPGLSHEFYTASPERKQEIWDYTLEDLQFELEREEIERHENEIALEERIFDVIRAGAGDRETALRWILEAEGLDADDLWYGVGYIRWHFNIGQSAAEQFQDAVAGLLRKAS